MGACLLGMEDAVQERGRYTSAVVGVTSVLLIAFTLVALREQNLSPPPSVLTDLGNELQLEQFSDLEKARRAACGDILQQIPESPVLVQEDKTDLKLSQVIIFTRHG